MRDYHSSDMFTKALGKIYDLIERAKDFNQRIKSLDDKKDELVDIIQTLQNRQNQLIDAVQGHEARIRALEGP